MSNALPSIIPSANLSDPWTVFAGKGVSRFITNRHGKVTVLSFVDGHAKPVSFEDAYRQQWYETYDTTDPVN
jgi:prepilin-type processing-associated H-X9-DG protein